MDFAVTDAIALSMGFSGDDPCRLDAAVLYELSHNLNNGHVFLPREKLVLAASQLIGVEPDAVELALDKLIQRYAVVEKPIAGVQEATDKGFGTRKTDDPDYDFYREIRMNNAVLGKAVGDRL